MAKQADLEGLIARVKDRESLADADAPLEAGSADRPGPVQYQNQRERLHIDFSVHHPPAQGAEVLQPRIVVVAPGGRTERHRHAHETVFVIVRGAGEVWVDGRCVPVEEGDVVHVPRWAFHQTRAHAGSELRVVAVTDFGFTSSILGDYTRRQRLKFDGADAEKQADSEGGAD